MCRSLESGYVDRAMPAGQVTKNCHYISRFLTRPWERDQRRFRVYNFERSNFENGFSASFFSEEGLNEQHVETWLDHTLERPLSNCRRKLAKGQLDALEDWSFYRAATLMLWLQGIRVRSLHNDDARRSLAILASCDVAETDQLVVSIRDEYDLALVRTIRVGDEVAPLFFPSTGIFPFSFVDSGCLSGWSVGLGLPLDLMSAVVAVPRNGTGIRDISRVPASIANFSVGTSAARNVVVPPIVLEGIGEAEIARNLEKQRVLNDNISSNVAEAKDLVISAFDVGGLAAPRDGAGRIPPRP